MVNEEGLRQVEVIGNLDLPETFNDNTEKKNFIKRNFRYDHLLKKKKS